MASIARSLRPVASRFVSRSCRNPSSAFRPTPSRFQARGFAASAVSQAKKYTKDHEWVEISDDGKTGVIGISTYAAHALGDVVYVELPEVPMEVEARDSIGAVESVKSASDILSPVTCTITEVNDLLDEKPSTINKGPEDDTSGGGWVAKIEIGEDGLKELEDLMDHQAYRAFTEEEGGE